MIMTFFLFIIINSEAIPMLIKLIHPFGRETLHRIILTAVGLAAICRAARVLTISN